MLNTEISGSLRAAIITLKIFTDLSYDEIECKIGIPSASIKSVYHKAVDRAGNHNFYGLLAHMGPRQ